LPERWRASGNSYSTAAEEADNASQDSAAAEEADNTRQESSAAEEADNTRQESSAAEEADYELVENSAAANLAGDIDRFMVEGAGFSRFGSAAAAKMVEGAGSSTFAVEQVGDLKRKRTLTWKTQTSAKAARRHRRTAYQYLDSSGSGEGIYTRKQTLKQTLARAR
jgi:hypothetical protein